MSSAGDILRSRVCHLPFIRRSKKSFVMLRAFFDDSGLDGKSPVFVMAGFFAPVSEWERFSDCWTEILERHKPRPLRYLKMREANSFREQFWGCGADDRHETLKRATLCIRNHEIKPIISLIPISDYNRIFLSRRFQQFFDRPYFISLFSIITDVYKAAEQSGSTERVDFVFDSQQDSAREIFEQWPSFNRACAVQFRDMLGTFPQFEKDEEFPPIQAADMLCWLLRRYYVEKANGRDPVSSYHNQYLANMLTSYHIRVADDRMMFAWANALSGIAPLLLNAGDKFTLPDPSNFHYYSSRSR